MTHIARYSAILMTTCMACGGFAAVGNTIPPKTVVFTFDDNVRSHLTVAAPLLLEYGFGATFFVSNAWVSDSANFLNWDEIAQLDKMGFEIGNHTWNHAAMHSPLTVDAIRDEINKVEEALAQHGITKPVSFCWPGCQFCPEAINVLREKGYKFARRGPNPGSPADVGPGMGIPYDPKVHDPLLIPCTGLTGPEVTVENLKAAVQIAGADKPAVVMFHGVPDEGHPFCSFPEDRFREFLKWLKEEGYNVIAMRDLGKYMDPSVIPDDPLVKTSFPE